MTTDTLSAITTRIRGKDRVDYRTSLRASSSSA